MWTDKGIDMTKLIVAFCNFVKDPNKKWAEVCVYDYSHSERQMEVSTCMCVCAMHASVCVCVCIHTEFSFTKAASVKQVGSHPKDVKVCQVTVNNCLHEHS